MKQYIKFAGALFAFGAIGFLTAGAQTSNSAYYLEGAQFRHDLNPAFDVQRNYVSFPLLGNLSLGMHSSAGVSNFLYETPNGQLTTFMNESVDRGQFLSDLPNRVRIGLNLQENILSAGFHAWNGFNTFALNLKSNTNVHVPKELFAFMKDPSETHYNVENFGLNTTNYLELAFGHSRKINEQWTVGAKAKILLGLARAEMNIESLDIETSEDMWRITPKNAELKAAIGGLMVPTKGETGNYEENDYVLDDNGDRTDLLKPGTNEQISYDDLDFNSDEIGLAGWGLAFDLGATYKFNDDWTFSAALLDLGFINWKDAVEGSMTNNFEFGGFHEVPVDPEDGNPNDIETQSDKLLDDLADLAKFKRDKQGGKMTTGIAATMNLGAQYTLPVYRKVKFGFLSSTRINGKNSWTEARVSANYAPATFFEMSLNYALSNFGSTAGLFLNLCNPYLGMFLGVDFPLGKMEPSYFAPINKFGARLNFGMNINFGKVKKNNKAKELNI